jgi:hypothetical protein
MIRRLVDERVSRSLLLGAVVLGLAACGGSGNGSHPIDGSIPEIDAPPPPPWWQPGLGLAKNWDIQLTAPIDVSTQRLMYDLDLWAVVPAATTIDYGGGSTVAVPAGALAGTIAKLHATTPPTIVICHFDSGQLDLSLPDAPKFPGYHADPAQIPDQQAPEAGSAIGWRVGTTMKRWLDIRNASRAAWTPIMFKRFELAKQIGCDGVDPDGNNANQTIGGDGFGATAVDAMSWFADIATEGHGQKLSTGMKNPSDSVIDNPASVAFDWLMVEHCGDPDILDCDSARPFINAHKPVFAIDFDHSEVGDPEAAAGECAVQSSAMIADGIYKDVLLTKNVWMECQPATAD